MQGSVTEDELLHDADIGTALEHDSTSNYFRDDQEFGPLKMSTTKRLLGVTSSSYYSTTSTKTTATTLTTTTKPKTSTASKMSTSSSGVTSSAYDAKTSAKTTEKITTTTKPTTVLYRPRYRYRTPTTTKPKTTTKACAARWAAWGSWTTCTKTCGMCGTKNRKRACNEASAGCNCVGNVQETEKCPPKQCPFPATTCCSGYETIKVKNRYVCG
ncbi:unnamed protein product, partial [Mesorhabditis spiculigera]